MPGDGAKDGIQRAESEWMVVRDRDPVVSRLGGFQDDVTAGLVDLRVLPSPAQQARETRRRRHEEFSCHQQGLVADP